MKKVLFATTALVASAGIASAEVALSGDGRMGIMYNSANAGNELSFTSRARVTFTLSGETDGGLSFGGSFRADNAGGAAGGTAGSVYIMGSFGKLAMGDVDSAAKNSVGHVAGVGLTGLGDLNEITYLQDVPGAQPDPTALYTNTIGSVSFGASVSNPGVPGFDPMFSLGMKYATDQFSVSLGLESINTGVSTLTHVVVGAGATFNNIALEARYGSLSVSGGGGTFDQFALSGTYTMDAVGVTAFYTDDSDFAGIPGLSGAEAYGIGMSYDLGGGASIKGGVARNQTTSTTVADFGVAMTF